MIIFLLVGISRGSAGDSQKRLKHVVDFNEKKGALDMMVGEESDDERENVVEL